MCNGFKDMDDFEALLNAPAIDDEARKAQIKEAEQKLEEANMVDCHKCGGSGMWASYSGFTRRPCFTCKGKGKITKQRQTRVKAAVKAKQTRRENLAAYHAKHAELYTFMLENKGWNGFFASMCQRLEESPLTENQEAACYRIMAKTIESREAKQQQRDADAPKADASKIHEIFNNALDAGKNRRALLAARFDDDGITVLDSIKMTPARDNERIWVKVNDVFCGGIHPGGILRLNRDAPEWLADRIMSIAADPAAEARLYGQRTGVCCCCSRTLTNKVSIDAGIGPICASNWGL